jgi:hypothetical protein
MIFLTVVPQLRPHPFGEGGQAVPMPLLQRLTGERLTGALVLIGENSDLVHKVRMLRPAGGTTSATSQTYSWFNQVTIASNHDRTSFRGCGVSQVQRSTGAAHSPDPAEAAGDLVAGWLRDQALDRPFAPIPG